MKTLLLGQIHDDALSTLKSKCQIIQMSQGEFDIVDKLDCEAIVFRTFNPIKKPQLDKLPKLKYAILCSVGTDNIDLDELKQRNIELIFIPGTNANSVAEHTLHLLLSLLREDSKRPFAELKGKTVGICGFGAIGKLVAKKLSGFECSLIAFDVIAQDQSVLNQLNVTMVPIEELFIKSNIISIHVPYMKATDGLINQKVLSLLQPNSFFINTSRAEVINETDLLAHAQRLRGIALDVYSPSLLQQLQNQKHPNLITTEHIAALGEDSFRAQCVRPVEEFLKKI